VSQGEAPKGYVPPPPTHPTYGYLTPEEIAELEAGERERAEAAELEAQRTERTEIVYLPPTPPVSTWAPSEPEPAPASWAAPEGESVPGAEQGVGPDGPAVWVPAPPAQPWVPEPAASDPEPAPEPEPEPAPEPEVVASDAEPGPQPEPEVVASDAEPVPQPDRDPEPEPEVVASDAEPVPQPDRDPEPEPDDDGYEGRHHSGHEGTSQSDPVAGEATPALVEQPAPDAQPDVVETEPTAEPVSEAAQVDPRWPADRAAGEGSPEQQWGTEQWEQQPRHSQQESGQQADNARSAPAPSQSQYGDHVWDPYQQRWVPQGQQIPAATQPAPESYQQWAHPQARVDTTAYTWQGENGELYAWDGQQWVLQGQAPGQPTPEPGPEQQHRQAAHQTSGDYTWDGPNGEHYVWNGQDWVLTDPGYAAASQQTQPEPRQQVNSQGELVYTWQGADGETYHWDPRLERWVSQGYQSR